MEFQNLMKKKFFKVNPDIYQPENIKLAQALNQETINNIQSDASPDLIPPDELQLNDSGQPSEELTTLLKVLLMNKIVKLFHQKHLKALQMMECHRKKHF